MYTGLPLELMKESTVEIGGTYSPQIIYAYPDKTTCAEAVPDFCLPQGVHVSQFSPVVSASSSGGGASPASQASRHAAALLADVKEVVFVLSGGGADGSEISYGMCLHLKRSFHHSEKVMAQADISYCFISQYPFLPLHLGVLRSIVRLHLSPEFAPLSNRGVSTSIRARTSFVLNSPNDFEQEREAILRITKVLNRYEGM